MSAYKFKQLVLKRRHALSDYRFASYALNVARKKGYRHFWTLLEQDVKQTLDNLANCDVMLDRFKPWRERLDGMLKPAGASFRPSTWHPLTAPQVPGLCEAVLRVPLSAEQKEFLAKHEDLHEANYAANMKRKYGR